MDKKIMERRFAKARNSYEQEAEVQREIAQKMIRLCGQFLPLRQDKMMDVGCGTGFYSRLLFAAYQPESLILNDICEDMRLCCNDLLCDPRVRFLPGDAEHLDIPGGQHLITSCSTLQWFQEPSEFFEKVAQCLVPRGFFAFSTFGCDNLKEVKTITRQGLSYHTLQELKIMLSENFDIIHAEEERLVLSFTDPHAVLVHMKKTGINGLSEASWNLRKHREFCKNYDEHFGENGRIPLTYHPVYFIVQKKD